MKELSFVVQSPTTNTILYLLRLKVIKHSGGLVTARNKNWINADASWPRKSTHWLNLSPQAKSVRQSTQPKRKLLGKQQVPKPYKRLGNMQIFWKQINIFNQV